MKLLRVLGLTLPMILAAANAAWGSVGEVIVLPSTVTSKSGLQVTINTTWVATNLPRPVRIRVAPFGGGVFPAERNIVVRVSTSGGTAETPIELPQGATQVDVSAASPGGDQPLVRIDFWEGGLRLDELCTQSTASGTKISRSSIICAVYVGDEIQPRQISARTGLKPNTNPADEVQAVNILAGLHLGFFFTRQPLHADDIPGFLTTAPEDLPTRMFDYAGVDFVVMPFGTAETMVKHHGKRWEAILGWCHAGGTLVICDVGENWAKIASLGMDSATSTHTVDGQPTPSSTWRMLRPTAPNAQDLLDRVGARKVSVNLFEVDVAKLTQLLPADFMALRPFGMGRVAAFPERHPWSDVAKFHQRFRLAHVAELGWHDPPNTTATQVNLAENRLRQRSLPFIIPGAGRPPVGVFLTIITLFAIAIGPLNYWLLRRAKRLYLLLVIVPAGSAVVTAALFAYALINDGLFTRVRVRSVTVLDESAGRISTWSRQVYYAGLSPSRGVVFPADALVDAAVEQNRSGRFRKWQGSEQRLLDGYFEPRTNTEFVVVRSLSTPLGLKANFGAAPSVQNNLGVRIHQLAVVHNGQWYSAASIGPGASAPLTPARSATMAVASAQVALQNQYLIDVNFNQGSRRRPVPKSVMGLNDSGELQFGPCLLERFLYRAGSDTAALLEPRGYIALVDRPEEVPLGIPGARETNSLHVIVGRW